MTVYAAATRTAADAIRKKGGPVVVVIETPGEYDPESSASAPSSATYNGYGALFEYGTLGSGRQRAANANVLTGDKELLLSALQASGEPMPRPQPEFTRVTAPDEVTYSVKGVKALEPDGVPILYELHLTAG